MKNKTAMLLLGSLAFILLGMALVAVLNRTAPGSSTDVRARAGTQNTLKLVGLVNSVSEPQGTFEVADVQFADTSRSGDAKSFGTWIVTAPPAFNFATIFPGSYVTIGVDASTFNVMSRAVNALTVTPGN